VKAALIAPVEEVASTAPAEAVLVIWTARLRIDHVAIFQASASKVFKAAALIEAAVAAGDLAAIASAAAEGLAEVTASAAEDLADSAAAALADSADAAGAGGNN
jgi:hypothetical protein